MSDTRGIQTQLMPAAASAGTNVITLTPSPQAVPAAASASVSLSTNDAIQYNALVFGEVIDKGSFATVYQGTYQGRPVAIKTLTNVTPETLKSFREEYQKFKDIQKFSLSCVPYCYGYSENLKLKTPSYNIVMEYLSGGTLFDLVVPYSLKSEYVSLSICFKIAMQLVHACIELHQHGIVQGDLKPENILFSASGTLKIVDYDFTEILDKTEAYKALKDYKGSARYVAPEIYNDKKMSRESDIFAVGSILFVLLASAVPLSHVSSDLKIVKKIARGDRAAIPMNRSPGLAKLINHCWMHKPAERPTAKDLYEGLQKLQAQLAKDDSLAQPSASLPRPKS
jgi:serine/threonine protein kinase